MCGEFAKSVIFSLAKHWYAPRNLGVSAEGFVGLAWHCGSGAQTTSRWTPSAEKRPWSVSEKEPPPKMSKDQGPGECTENLCLK
jgi:hypothetical protein